MHVGLQVSWFSWSDDPSRIGPTFGRIAQNAETAGMSSLWVMDHFFQIRPAGPPERDMLEAYTTLAYAAALTHRIELGTMVTGVTYRHPGLLVKTVTTLDVLSGGRAWLGIGAAWNEQEHRALGVPFPPAGERLDRLEEALQIAHRMWRGDQRPFEGRHYRLERPLNSPQSLRRPHPPILVGGGGERRTLRLVAQYADACNIFDMGPQKVQAKYDVLARHCEQVGRPVGEVDHTVLARMTLARNPGAPGPSGERTISVDQAVDRIGALGQVGTDTVILGMGNDSDDDAYPLVAELIRQVA